MSPFLEVVIRITMLGYGVAMLLALWRALRGPTAQDRVLAVDFITIVAMLLMLVVGIRYASSMYLEAALLLPLFDSQLRTLQQIHGLYTTLQEQFHQLVHRIEKT